MGRGTGPGRGIWLEGGPVAAVGWRLLQCGAPGAGAGSGLLLSVTATGPANVTAAGHNTTANGPTAAIILSWNGSAWTKVNVPKVGATEELDSASAAPGGTITWAFGRSTNSQGVVSNLTLRND